MHQEVASTRMQAAAVQAQAAEHVASVQARAAHELASVHAQASSAVAGAQVQAVQQLASLRADYEVREKELLERIQSLQSQLHAPAVSMSPNGTAVDSRLERLEAKVDYLHSMFQGFDQEFRTKMDQALLRVSQLEEWYDDGQHHVNDEEELVAAPSSPVHAGVGSSVPIGHSVSMPVRTLDEVQGNNLGALNAPMLNPFSSHLGNHAFTPPTRIGHENHDNPFGLPRERARERYEVSTAEDDASLEDSCFHWKEVTAIKFPSLPESAGSLRQWKNVILPMLTALDRSPEAHLITWLRKAFDARTAQDIQALKMDSEGFPKFDRMLCSWFTRGDSLKGYFGPRIQAYIEETMTVGVSLRGRPLLNMVVREFDLDNALGGVISGVELFQLPSPEGDVQSLVHF